VLGLDRLSLDRTQTIQMLFYLVAALFVAGGVVSARYRQPFRRLAIGLYGAAVALALVWVGVWLFGK
jgi:hypothetical protein